MLYFDTSFLLPYFTTEASSTAVEAFFSRHDFESFTISQWTATEFHSAISFKIRSGQLAAAMQDAILERFATARAETFLVVLPTAADFELAGGLLRDWKSGLRSGDALHLAIARNREATLVTLDKTLLKVARSLKIAHKTLPGS